MKFRKNMKYIVADSFHYLYGKVGTCVNIKRNKLTGVTVELEFPSGLRQEISPKELVPLLKRVK